jgi:hypothetical protein
MRTKELILKMEEQSQMILRHAGTKHFDSSPVKAPEQEKEEAPAPARRPMKKGQLKVSYVAT